MTSENNYNSKYFLDMLRDAKDTKITVLSLFLEKYLEKENVREGLKFIVEKIMPSTLNSNILDFTDDGVVLKFNIDVSGFDEETVAAYITLLEIKGYSARLVQSTAKVEVWVNK